MYANPTNDSAKSAAGYGNQGKTIFFTLQLLFVTLELLFLGVLTML
jgi:hypothetical protein